MTQPTKSNRSQKIVASYAQALVLKKMKAYLENRGRGNNFYTEGLLEGYCFGITTLWLYSRWLSFQPKTSDTPRDDYIWFQNAISEILEWDEEADKKNIEKKDIDAFERLLAYIELFQKPWLYFPERIQRNLDLTLEDTKGRKPANVYSIAGSFTLSQLQHLLEYKNVIQNNTLIIISANGHATGLFKNGDALYYFNSNNPTGEEIRYHTDRLARYIFRAHTFKFDRLMINIKNIFYSLFGLKTEPKLQINISMFSLIDTKDIAEKDIKTEITKIRASYPEPETVLEHILNPSTDKKTKVAPPEEAKLAKAVFMQDPGSVSSLLASGADPNAKDENGRYVFATALILGDAAIIKILLETMIHPPSNINPLTKGTIESSVEQYAKYQERQNEWPSLSSNAISASIILGGILSLTLAMAIILAFPPLIAALTAGTFLNVLALEFAFTLIGAVIGYIVPPFVYKRYKRNKEKTKTFSMIERLKKKLEKEPTKKPGPKPTWHRVVKPLRPPQSTSPPKPLDATPPAQKEETGLRLTKPKG